MRLTHVEADPPVPVEPPLDLAMGQEVELWWVIDVRGLRYEHAGSERR
jgi:hypothetical protein